MTLPQARDAAGAVGSRIALGENVPDARAARRESEKLTVAGLIDAYFENRGDKRLRERSRSDYRSLMVRNVIPHYGPRPAADLTADDVAHLHSKITARPAARQANYTVAVLRAIYSWAVKRKLVAVNPAKGIDLNPEHHRERFASQDEIGRLRSAFATMADRLMADAFTLLLLTGARSGEVLNATWSQFDLDTPDLAVWTKPASTTKQKRTHRLPLSRDAADVLRAIRKVRPGTANAYVFPDAAGGRITDRMFAHRWEILRQSAGLSDLKKHDLRHTAASILAASGASLPQIGAVLGHSTPVTTSRYAHLVDGVTRAAVEQIASAVARPTKATAPVVEMTAHRARG